MSQQEEYEKRLDEATAFESFWTILGDCDESDEWFYRQYEKALLLASTVEEVMQVWEEQGLGTDLDTRTFAKALELSRTQEDLESIVNTFFETRDKDAETVLFYRDYVSLVFARMEELGIHVKDSDF